MPTTTDDRPRDVATFAGYDGPPTCPAHAEFVRPGWCDDCDAVTAVEPMFPPRVPFARLATTFGDAMPRVCPSCGDDEADWGDDAGASFCPTCDGVICRSCARRANDDDGWCGTCARDHEAEGHAWAGGTRRDPATCTVCGAVDDRGRP